MSYVDRLLAPGETVLHRTLRHWVVLMRWIGSAVVLAVLGLVMASIYGLAAWQGAGIGAWVGLALLAIAVLVALPGYLRWASEVYLVTDRRVIRVEGVLRKQALDSGLAKVNDVRLTQTVPGRMLGYGTLEIITASDSGINRLEYLPRPMEFKKAMMTAAATTGGLSAVAAAAAAPLATATSASSPRRSPADRLADLDELHRRGQLNDEEYRAKREAILADV
ncbi:MAG TPA: PH domain-containing protein [Thermoanaerobaculia bacterium]|jgi:uncharacterized membrane protein YdbT with pleckstrin-like domain|nr:PH domain-containing protein [Thermoanaerobaculia bacterium]